MILKQLNMKLEQLDLKTYKYLYHVKFMPIQNASIKEQILKKLNIENYIKSMYLIL